MKKRLLFIPVFTLFLVLSVKAEWGLWNYDRSWIIFNIGTYSVWNGGPGAIQNADLGTYINNESLLLHGYDVKTWKNGSSDVTGGTFYYTIYPKGNRPYSPTFTSVTLYWIQDLGGGNQKWGFGNQNINLLNNLTPGEYTLEFYAEMYGTNPNQTHYDSNNGYNYVAHFRYNYVRSAASGSWNSTSSWLNSKIPGSAQIAEIDHSITVSSPVTVGSVIINSGKTLTIDVNQSLTVTGTINNQAGNSGLVINSTSSGTGSLIHQNTGVNATVKRYHNNYTTPQAGDGWHFLSSPVAAQPISAFHTPGQGNDFYKWDEPTNTWINRTDPNGNLNTSFETNFVVGRGYLVAYAAAGTKEFTGEVNVSNVSVTGLTKTVNGWHLLGNPFGSALAWNKNGGSWNLNNVAANCQIWNNSSSSYTVIQPDQIIPAMNGFMVYTSGNGSLTIPASAREHSTTGWYKSDKMENQIVLVAHDLQYNTSQETIIAFHPQATDGFDMEYDSYFLAGYAPKFYSISSGEKYALNTFPSMAGHPEIPLGFVRNDATQFSIELKQTIANQQITLKDLKTGIEHPLNQSPYVFTSDPNDDPERFLLKLNATGLQESLKKPSIVATSQNNRLVITTNEAPMAIQVYDFTGRLIMETEISSAGTYYFMKNFKSGIYLIHYICQGIPGTVKIYLH